MEKAKKKIWPVSLLTMKKNKEKIAVLTAYDYPTAKIIEESNVHVVLVGDSLGNVIAGLPNTLGVTMEQMLYHSTIVKRAIHSKLLISDMPYLSYHISAEEAVKNAGRFIQEAGADAVKMEGGIAVLKDILPAMKKAQIAVMGHLGLTPQSVIKFGGYRVQGREKEAQEMLLEDALFLQEAGCFSLVLEGIPEELGKRISETLEIPTIGIGAGRFTDGQVLVFHDLMGYEETPPKFVRKYADLRGTISQSLEKFVADVQGGIFPSEEEIYK
jgi:3-methyl-2-oxobutanoate hydroxymethyltransferase